MSSQMGLLDLPPELLREIALFLHSPSTLDEYDVLCGDGIFTCLAGSRYRDKHALVTFGATCHAVRSVVRPLLFFCADINTPERAHAVVAADWCENVTLLKLLLYTFPPNEPESGWISPSAIAAVCEACPNVEHLEFDIYRTADFDPLEDEIDEFTDDEGRYPLQALIHALRESMPPSFVARLKSLCFRFTDPIESGLSDEVELFLHPAPNLEFFLVEDGCGDSGVTYTIESTLEKLPSLRALTLKGASFEDLSSLLGQCTWPRLIHLYVQDGISVLTDPNDWSIRFPSLETFCYEERYRNVEPLPEEIVFASRCTSLQIIGSARQTSLRFTTERSESSCALREYRPGDLTRLWGTQTQR